MTRRQVELAVVKYLRSCASSLEKKDAQSNPHFATSEEYRRIMFNATGKLMHVLVSIMHEWDGE